MVHSTRTFTVSGENITIVGNPTLVFINPDTDVGIEILRCWAKQLTTTTEQLRIRFHTQVTVFPTLVSATPAPHELGQTSKIVGNTTGAAGTCGINASAEGAGSQSVIVPSTFNNQIGFEWLATPEERIVLRAGASSGFGMRLLSTPTTLNDWHFGVTFAEL